MWKRIVAPKFLTTTSSLAMKGYGDKISSSLIVTNTKSAGKVRIHCVSGYISTLFLCHYIETNDLLLLDTGMPTDFERIQCFVDDRLKDESGQKPELRTVVSTHCHVDHIGAAWKHVTNGTTVQTTKGFENYYRGWGGKLQQVLDGGLALLFAWRLGRRIEYTMMPLFKPLPKKVRQLQEGVSVHGFDDWTAIYCPGHTAHMVMLYHPETQILYGADFFVAHRNEFRAPVPVDILEAYSWTLKRLRHLRVKIVLLAHGGIVDVDEMGGWDSILNDIELHLQKEDRHFVLRMIKKFLIGWSTEARYFDRASLPKTRLPEGWEQPTPAHIAR